MNSTIEDLTRESKFIFKGTVKKLNASTMRGIPVDSMLAVIRVDEVFKVPMAIADYTGQDITVQLSTRQKMKAGQQAVFFTEGWVYGESIAVRAFEERVWEGDNRGLRKQISDAMRNTARHALRARLASSHLIIVGKVSDMKAAKPEARQPVTFRDPQWKEALIEVEVMLKGNVTHKKVEIRFPNSADVMWHKAPKFRVGQEGIWLLHKTEARQLTGDTYTALHPTDFQSKDQIDTIRTLLNDIA
ncbi:hypothetical protein HYR54_15325 [Candidatus Acetothermia bacterium]|nr:hypothetical protein [Candidatus Acetothermia bacterium]